MTIQELLTPMLALSGGAGLLYYLKGLPALLFRKAKRKLIHTATIYQYDELFNALEAYLSKRCKNKYNDVEALIDVEDNKSIIYKQEENFFVYHIDGKKVLISKGKEKLDKAQSLKEVYFRKFIVRGFRARKQIEKLLSLAAQEWSSYKNQSNVKLYLSDSYGDWVVSNVLKPKSMDRIIIDAATKEFIIKDLIEFNKSEKWYSDRGISYKRGYCFYGAPGNGKTSLSLALASLSERSVFVLNLNSIESDVYLSRAITRVPFNSILLIEDIDGIFNGRERVKEKGISFSALLNTLDGALSKHGLISIITTNHIEKLDPALLRDGRMDVKVELENPTEVEISSYLSMFYEKDVQVKGEFSISMASVQGICLANRNSISKCKMELHRQLNKDERVTQQILTAVG